MNTNQFDLLKTRRFLPLFLTQSFGAFNDNLQSLLDARETHGSGHEALEDVERKPMSYGRLITGAFVLGRALSRGTQSGEHVGVLLPNAAANAVTFFGLLAHGRVPAMINFSRDRHRQCGQRLRHRRYQARDQLTPLHRDGQAAGHRRWHDGQRGASPVPGGRRCIDWYRCQAAWPAGGSHVRFMVSLQRP